METGCIFCSLDKSLIFFETLNFALLYDPYPLTEGHLLLISKMHFGCAGELPEKIWDELLKIKEIATISIKNISLQVSAFEHGRAGSCIPKNPGFESNCHHFHMHILPFKYDLNNELKNKFESIKLKALKDVIKYFSALGNYLFFENSNQELFFYPLENNKIPSHYMRTRISKELKYLERANWLTYQNYNLLKLNQQKLPKKLVKDVKIDLFR